MAANDISDVKYGATQVLFNLRYFSASTGELAAVRYLLKQGADVNAESSSGKTPLLYACIGGYEDVVTLLLESTNANVDVHIEERQTPLMETVKTGHVGVAKILLDWRANQLIHRFTDDIRYQSPLFMTVGANIDQATVAGYTLLMLAAVRGRHKEMVKLLLSEGADINALNQKNETALLLAAAFGFTELAAVLIEAGADIELGGNVTPLMEASRFGHLDLVRSLLQAGANAHAQTETGDTALRYACVNGHTHVVELLRQCLMEATKAGHVGVNRKGNLRPIALTAPK